MTIEDRDRPVRRYFILLSVVWFAGCSSLSDVFVAHSETAARVGEHELSVATLAEIFVVGSDLPLTRDAVDQLARHWVEVMLVARRSATGDSLFDRTIVLEAMWPTVRQILIAELHDSIFSQGGELSPSAVDSAYRVGEMRMLAHILRRVTAETTPEEKEQQRAVAERIHRQLVAGSSWEAANEQNEDAGAQQANGSLGVVKRGETVPKFENVAFALGPGDLSEVTETRFGFHIVYRPHLDEVRERFAEATDRELAARFDSVYGDDLLRTRGVEVRSRAPAIIQEAMDHPLRSLGSSTALATFSNGRFTIGQFLRWLQYLSSEIQQQVLDAPDDQIVDFVRRLVLQELLWQQVDSAGIQLSDSVYDLVQGQHLQNLIAVWEAAGIAPDSLVRAASMVLERELIGAFRVDQYLKAFAAGEVPLQSVQPFLAALLWDDVNWEIVPAGIERVVERASRLRAALSQESTTVIQPELNIR